MFLPAEVRAPRHLHIAVIGAGSAGRSFALLCAQAGFNVVLEDVMPDKLRRVEQESSGTGTAVRLVATVEDAVRNADLAIDFVPDELESKLEIWSLIDRMAPPKTIMCTPSQTLSITDLASCTYRADRCIMMRGELRAGATVRMLSARETSPATRTTAARILSLIGCYPVEENDPDLPMLLKNMRAASL